MIRGIGTVEAVTTTDVLGWRNWQTRMVEVHMEQSLGVQVPPRVPFFSRIGTIPDAGI